MGTEIAKLANQHCKCWGDFTVGKAKKVKYTDAEATCDIFPCAQYAADAAQFPIFEYMNAGSLLKPSSGKAKEITSTTNLFHSSVSQTSSAWDQRDIVEMSALPYCEKRMKLYDALVASLPPKDPLVTPTSNQSPTPNPSPTPNNSTTPTPTPTPTPNNSTTPTPTPSPGDNSAASNLIAPSMMSIIFTMASVFIAFLR